MRTAIRLLVLAAFLTAPAAYAGAGYIGASAGITTIEAGSLDADDSSLKFFGGYKRSRALSFEAGYVDFGDPDDVSGGGSIAVDLTGWNFFAVGTLPIGERFELFGKGGILFWDADFSGSGFSGGDDGTELAFGVGAAWALGKSLRIRGEYEFFEIDNVDDVTMISAGVEWRF